MKKKIAVLTCAWNTFFVKEFIKGMKNAIKDNDVDLYIFNAYDYTEYSGFLNYTGFSIYNLINYEDFDGAIILSDLINNARILEKERQKILKAGKPAVTISKPLGGVCNIKIDNYTGLYEMLEHLVKTHGCTDFAYISGKEQFIDYAERYKAFRTYMTENKLKLTLDNVYTIDASEYHCAYNFFKTFFKEGKKLPQVFVCANDLIAIALLKVCTENNVKVPEQLKIVGYDGLPYTQGVNPSISTVKNNIEQAGFEALTRVLLDNTLEQNIKISGNPVYGWSCGCSSTENQTDNLLMLKALDNSNRKEEFDSQLELISEIFTEAPDVFTLLTNIETFLSKSHSFEGSDFCIFMKADWSSVLINSTENLPLNLTYGSQVQSICSIQNGVKYPREMISTKDLVPSKMKNDKSNVFLFMPIFHHSYVHGYFVTKNNLEILDNRNGYKWTRNFGTSLEHFRKKNMFKQMSQQYLKLSTKDALSGMLNRSGLEKLAKPFFKQNKVNGLTTVLFFVDINKMKFINDQFGHLHGDLAVKTVSAAVLETVPKNWLCIRYGGDEFLVVGNSRNYNGEDYCYKIKERLAQKTSVMRLPYNLSASVGTYSVPSTSDMTLEQAIETVDDIMYKQKQEFHKIHGPSR